MRSSVRLCLGVVTLASLPMMAIVSCQQAGAEAAKPAADHAEKAPAAPPARETPASRPATDTEVATTPKAPTPPDAATLAACKKKDRTACATGCDGADMPSCLGLGQILLNEKDRAVQQQCRDPLLKACNAGLGKACAKLSDCLEGLAGDHESEVAAARAKACELNDGTGCLLAGQLAKGFELLPKQCEAGDSDACYSLALEYQWGTFKTLPKDSEMAAKFSKKACMLGNQDGCHAYVNWH